ncbi:MAG: hypothetical protein HY908_27865 [Myxococcales bacterium]|nr:hypothetical protein [Myxococcales bacterium]
MSAGGGSMGRLGAAAAGLGCALPLAVYLADFTVDDALIAARYAAHLAAGHGYRFNASGPVTDGVTPLGWPYLLAPFAGGGPATALLAAKVLGLAAWALGAAALGLCIRRLGVRRRRWLALLLVAGSAPLAAWAAAGMETGVALGLGAAAVALRAARRERTMAACAGLLAWLRPEALPFAVALALGPPRRGAEDEAPRSPRERAVALALAVVPWLAAALVRFAVFGRALPLSLAAKPSDLTHGASYALGAWLLTGGLAALAWWKLPGWVRGLAVAVLVHFLAVAVAGGDWMPLARLVVPVLPAVVVVAAASLEHAALPFAGGRLALALAGEIYLLAVRGPAAARVGADRRALVRELEPVLAGRAVVGALDIGWLGAATDATIVDFAGVTDPAVAALPGGHTTRPIPAMLLEARRVDTLVLLLSRDGELAAPWTESPFARGVERWVALGPGMADDFEPVVVATPPALRYLVLYRRAR